MFLDRHIESSQNALVHATHPLTAMCLVEPRPWSAHDPVRDADIRQALLSGLDRASIVLPADLDHKSQVLNGLRIASANYFHDYGQEVPRELRAITDGHDSNLQKQIPQVLTFFRDPDSDIPTHIEITPTRKLNKDLPILPSINPVELMSIVFPQLNRMVTRQIELDTFLDFRHQSNDASQAIPNNIREASIILPTLEFSRLKLSQVQDLANVVRICLPDVHIEAGEESVFEHEYHHGTSVPPEFTSKDLMTVFTTVTNKDEHRIDMLGGSMNDRGVEFDMRINLLDVLAPQTPSQGDLEDALWHISRVSHDVFAWKEVFRLKRIYNSKLAGINDLSRGEKIERYLFHRGAHDPSLQTYQGLKKAIIDDSPVYKHYLPKTMWNLRK